MEDSAEFHKRIARRRRLTLAELANVAGDIAQRGSRIITLKNRTLTPPAQV
jgi:hypothetical protein